MTKYWLFKVQVGKKREKVCQIEAVVNYALSILVNPSLKTNNEMAAQHF